MTKIKLFLLFSGALWPSLLSAQTLIDENYLLNLARQENPSTQLIEAQKATANVEDSITQDKFNPKLAASYDYSSSKEDAIIQFAPVFRPQKLFQAGVEKNFSLGMKVSTGVFSQQISTAGGLINNATQVGAQLGVEIDLWKNFLGRLDRAEIQSKQLNKKVNELQSQVDRHGFVVDVRKIYWAMVANELSLDLSQQLVTSAKKQLADSKRRARDGAADRGDVSRNRAQVQSRESAVLFFTYQREVYVSALKKLLPGLKGKSFKISTGDRVIAEQKTRQCATTIMAQPNPNKKHSQYPEIISMLEERREREMRLAHATDSMDLKLTGRMQASGVDMSHQDAYDRLTDDFKNGYQVGVALKIPLGSDLRKARESRVLAVNNQIGARKEQLSLQLRAEHEKVSKALNLLEKALESQNGTVTSLTQSLKQTKRKYRQARVPLNTLILEQDNLFNAQLQEIDTKKQILHLLFDYFKIFPKHPCQMNIAMGAQS